MIVNLKTHLVVREVHEEYHINWSGKIIDTHPKLRDGKPITVYIPSKRMRELLKDWINKKDE